MRAYLQLDKDRFISLEPEKLDSITPSLEYNPMPLEGGVVGFYLRGSKIMPVVDLHQRLSISRKRNKLYLICCGVAFIAEYDSLTRQPKGEELDLRSIAKEVLKDLGVR